MQTVLGGLSLLGRSSIFGQANAGGTKKQGSENVLASVTTFLTTSTSRTHGPNIKN